MIKAYAAQEAGGTLEAFQYDPGVLGSGEVEIAVDYCGICHSDLNMLNNDWGITTFPFVPGHEIAGHILQVGDQVRTLAIGDKVGLGWHSGYCNSCTSCLSNDQNMCALPQETIVGRHGGFADKVRASAESVFKLPEGLDFESAGPLFCAGITVFNPLIQYDIKPSDSIAVIGIGGLGHIALQFLRAWGCEVTAFTSSVDKRTEALSLGAHHTVSSRDEAEIMTKKGCFDMVISTVNVKLNWSLYLKTLKPKGRLHFVGAALEPLNINAFSLITGQASISGSSVGSPGTIATMLEFASQHAIKPVVQKFKFDQANEAIAHLASGKANYRVVLER